MRQRDRIGYKEASEGEEDASMDSGSDGSGSSAQAGRKRAVGDATGLSKRRKMSPSPEAVSWQSEEDVIESADELSGEEDGGQRGAGKAPAATSKPQRQSGRAWRSAALQQALVESGSEEDEGHSDGGRRRPRRAAAIAKPQYRDASSGDEEVDDQWSDEEQRSSGARRPRRAAAAAKPNYRGQPAEDDEEEGEAVEDASEAQPSELEEEQSSEEEEEAEEEEEDSDFAPRRRRLPARQARKRRSPADARRSGRSTARVNYNLDAMLGEDDFEEEETSSSSSSEEEQEDDDSGPSRPTRRAAKLAGKAIRQQAGGSKKKRRQPARAAAPAKRRNVIEDSESEDGEGQERSGTRSGSPAAVGGSIGDDSGSDYGSEYEVDAADVEKILDIRPCEDGSGEEVFCKLQGLSYRKARWLPRDLLAADRSQLLGNFLKRQAAGELNPYGDLISGVAPQHLQVDRIIAHRVRNGRTLYLTKWQGLGYAEATWEDRERDLADDQAHIGRYERFNTPPSQEELLQRQEAEGHEIDTSWVPDFCSGRQLRDYQRVSLDWMASNWAVRRNCILGDEMGLGKTAQSISVLAYQRQFCKIRGPFLIIAPLTTLGHWQREVETWTDMNCVVYAGTAQDRAAIQKYDLWFPAEGRQRQRTVKPNVVLAAYETVRTDKGLFQAIPWETVIIDEAHRMKSTGSSTRAAMVGMDISWLLLLTGTPVQNNMRELFGILNLLDPQRFGDEEEFLEEFGDESAGMMPEQVKALQEELRPILLRRMKEDVETLPEKEEVIIWVELTPEQRAYYRAIYENEIGTLLAGASSKNLPNMRNLAMELRKVCCHSYLCNGLEEDIQRRKLEAGVEAGELDQLVAASGKMVLLHKLLPKLKSEGRKVLIFSQFKIMLDVLEDYLRLAGHATERIDGSTAARDRQAAIDRFSREGSDGFVFLLSTRAGGQGITLTAADTCIIYDSDWNPQNDLQAMARCHRIGQEKEVTIYRLLSKSTYEENVFQISSRKYGLDEAILGGLGASDSGNPEDDSRKIAELLKHGAHCLQAPEAANEQSGAFAAEGIDEILQGRTEKRQIGGRAGNTFSVATFAVGPSAGGEAGNDRSYWTALLPGAAEEHEQRLAAKRAPVILAPRQRKQVDYKSQLTGRVGRQPSADDADAEYVANTADADDDDDLILPKGKKARAGDSKRWTLSEVQEFLHRLVQFGQGRLERVREEAGLVDRSMEECSQLEAGALRALRQAAVIAAEQEKAQGAQRAEADAAAVQQGDGGAAISGGAAAAAPAPAVGGKKGQEAKAGGEGGGEEKDRSKKAKDRSVAVALEAWIEAEMGGEPQAVLQALRTKAFLDFANSAPVKTQQTLHTRRLLASWVARIRQEDAAAERSPSSRLTLPWLKGRTPGHWRGSWQEADTRRLMEALHELGWVARRGRAQSELLDAMLSDKRFGFSERVQRRREELLLASPHKPADLQGQQLQAAAQAEPMQTDGQQQAAGDFLEGKQTAPVAARPGASPAPSPAKHKQGPRILDSKDWEALCKGMAAFINNNLLPALEHSPPKRRAPAPDGDLNRASAARGSSSNLPSLEGQPKKKKKSKLAVGNAAAAPAAGAATGGGDAEGISPSSDATPPGAGKAGAAGPAATGFTNPLTTGAAAGGSGAKPGSGEKAGGSARKPPLSLQRSTGPKGGKGKTQKGIMQFLTKKVPAAGESPTGRKENEQRHQLQRQQEAGGSKAQDARMGEEIGID
ncbi:hypothetical protein ABPG77_002081 [Micractinium sp. CCAP 211/92]